MPKTSNKAGKNREKCQKYRQRVGKPLGPGVPGNKAGKNKAYVTPEGRAKAQRSHRRG